MATWSCTRSEPIITSTSPGDSEDPNCARPEEYGASERCAPRAPYAPPPRASAAAAATATTGGPGQGRARPGVPVSGTGTAAGRHRRRGMNSAETTSAAAARGIIKTTEAARRRVAAGSARRHGGARATARAVRASTTTNDRRRASTTIDGRPRTTDGTSGSKVLLPVGAAARLRRRATEATGVTARRRAIRTGRRRTTVRGHRCRTPFAAGTTMLKALVRTAVRATLARRRATRARNRTRAHTALARRRTLALALRPTVARRRTTVARSRALAHSRARREALARRRRKTRALPHRRWACRCRCRAARCRARRRRRGPQRSCLRQSLQRRRSLCPLRRPSRRLPRQLPRGVAGETLWSSRPCRRRCRPAWLRRSRGASWALRRTTRPRLTVEVSSATCKTWGRRPTRRARTPTRGATLTRRCTR
mmetsp:Transcript_27548/g.92532  ORF Transcript_27548/g.92532 Transcript_27548/m.92532 type:complete len:424 (+) Transcript_27548:347-1618(+)